LAGWGRMGPCPCHVYRPERERDLEAILRERAQANYIARGLGRSYGDTAANEDGGVIDTTRLNRMLAFDADTGVLTCEGGVGLSEIVDVFLPRGFFLPVTPGTKFVTVGGAIANDVHGKNHHGDGTFAQFVEEFELLTPGGERLTCSPETNTGVFWATAGGIGLTGLILEARIRLQRVQSAYVVVDYHRSHDLEDALDTMTASDDQYRYSVAWVDCLAGGKSLGRSVLMRGNHATPDQLPAALKTTPLSARGKRAKTVPFECPRFLLNPLSIRAFNACFYGFHSNAEGRIVDYDSFFYPLDGIHHWNRLYGKKGFVQYQATLPPDSVKGLVQLLERLSASRRASFLAVLKRCGEGNPGPNRAGLVPFLHELDAILLDHGGRLYLAKDITAKPETLAAMYPRLDTFREIKGRLDPDGVLSSNMARRLGIVNPGETAHA